MAGSSDFPTSIDNKTALVDGLDYIEADNVNNAYVPINKTQTFIGASGAGQSHNTDLLTFLNKGIFGCGIKYSSTSAVIVQAGQIEIPNSGLTIKKIRHTTSDSSLVAATDMDTGTAFTNSTAHYIYATADSAVTTPVYKISTNASAPSGFTNYRRIGGFYVDGSGNIIFVWSDNRPDVKPGDVIYQRVVDVSSTDSTATTVPHDGSKPQTASEGKQITAFATVIVPTSTTDIVEVDVSLHLAGSASAAVAGYLAKDSDADALSVNTVQCVGNEAMGRVRVFYRYVPGAVTPITFKVFFGPTGGTGYFNTTTGGTTFGSTVFSRMTIRVIKGAISA